MQSSNYACQYVQRHPFHTSILTAVSKFRQLVKSRFHSLVSIAAMGPAPRKSLYSGGFFGEHFADAFDLGADGAEFFFDVFVAAIDVVDAVDDGLAIGDQGR